MTIDRQKDPYPEPPAGYQPAVLFEYPRIKLQIAAFIILAVIMPLLLFLTWVLQGRPARGSLVGVEGVADFVVVVITVLATAPVHELIHGVAYRLLGYRVSYGASLRLLAAYAAAFGQWQKRDHNFIVALAPLVVLTALLLPLLAVSNHTVVLMALTALLMNAGGAVADLYLTWRLSRLSRATLLYDVDIKNMLIFVPVNAEGGF